MKLGESLNRSSVEYRPADSLTLAAMRAFLEQDAQLIQHLAVKMTLWKKSISDFLHFYFIKVDDTIAGWVGLKPKNLYGKEVLAIDLIFFVEQFRNTKAVAVFLHAPLTVQRKDLLGQPSGLHMIDWVDDKDEFI